MKTFIASQLNPQKSMKQLIADRCAFRLVVVAFLAITWCL